MTMGQNLPRVLRVSALLAVLLACLVPTSEYVCVHFLHLDFLPYNHMTLGSKDAHADVRMFQERINHLGTPTFFSAEWGSHFLYPAPNAVLYRLFHANGPHFLARFAAFFVVLFGTAAIWFFLALRRAGVTTTSAALFVMASVASSYPLYFTLERGNVEMFVWSSSALGIFFFLRDRTWLAASFIAAAGACKGYPFLFLGVFLLRRMYKQIAYAAVFATLMNVVSLWLETHNFALAKAGTAAGVLEFKQAYVLQVRANGLDHSIFGTLKRVSLHTPTTAQLTTALPIYLGIAGVVACVLFFTLVRRLPLYNQILFLTVMAITLPPVSYDYTLLHVYTPWAMLVFLAVRLWRQKQPPAPGMWAMFLCFSILLSPQNEVILHGERLEGAIKCTTLLFLAWLSLRYPLSTQYDLPASARAERQAPNATQPGLVPAVLS